MATTDQIRVWYHEGIVLNHDKRGTPGYWPQCNHKDAPRVAFPKEGGGFYDEPVHPLTVEAFNAYAATMRAFGETLPSGGGVNSCRNIAGTNLPSLHAYLCAIDIPPNSRKSSSFVNAIGRIRTHSGARVFRTLRSDRMHDQIDCSPADLATGIDWTTVTGEKEDDMALVSEIQKALNKAGARDFDGKKLIVDGQWGPRTESAFINGLNLGATGPPGPKGDPGPPGPKGDPGPAGSLTFRVTGDKEVQV